MKLRKKIAVALVAIMGIMGVTAGASPATAATGGCDIIHHPMYQWYTNGDLWSTSTVLRSSGCGEVTLRWSGWYGTQNECANAKARIYNEDNSLRREGLWRSVCGEAFVELIQNVNANMKVRIYIQAQRIADQRHDVTPWQSRIYL